MDNAAFEDTTPAGEKAPRAQAKLASGVLPVLSGLEVEAKASPKLDLSLRGESSTEPSSNEAAPAHIASTASALSKTKAAKSKKKTKSKLPTKQAQGEILVQVSTATEISTSTPDSIPETTLTSSSAAKTTLEPEAEPAIMSASDAKQATSQDSNLQLKSAVMPESKFLLSKALQQGKESMLSLAQAQVKTQTQVQATSPSSSLADNQGQESDQSTAKMQEQASSQRQAQVLSESLADVSNQEHVQPPTQTQPEATQAIASEQDKVAVKSKAKAKTKSKGKSKVKAAPKNEDVVKTQAQVKGETTISNKVSATVPEDGAKIEAASQDKDAVQTEVTPPVQSNVQVTAEPETPAPMAGGDGLGIGPLALAMEGVATSGDESGVLQFVEEGVDLQVLMTKELNVQDSSGDNVTLPNPLEEVVEPTTAIMQNAQAQAKLQESNACLQEDASLTGANMDSLIGKDDKEDLTMEFTFKDAQYAKSVGELRLNVDEPTTLQRLLPNYKRVSLNNYIKCFAVYNNKVINPDFADYPERFAVTPDLGKRESWLFCKRIWDTFFFGEDYTIEDFFPNHFKRRTTRILSYRYSAHGEIDSSKLYRLRPKYKSLSGLSARVYDIMRPYETLPFGPEDVCTPLLMQVPSKRFAVAPKEAATSKWLKNHPHATKASSEAVIPGQYQSQFAKSDASPSQQGSFGAQGRSAQDNVGTQVQGTPIAVNPALGNQVSNTLVSGQQVPGNLAPSNYTPIPHGQGVFGLGGGNGNGRVNSNGMASGIKALGMNSQSSFGGNSAQGGNGSNGLKGAGTVMFAGAGAGAQSAQNAGAWSAGYAVSQTTSANSNVPGRYVMPASPLSLTLTPGQGGDLAQNQGTYLPRQPAAQGQASTLAQGTAATFAQESAVLVGASGAGLSSNLALGSAMNVLANGATQAAQVTPVQGTRAGLLPNQAQTQARNQTQGQIGDGQGQGLVGGSGQGRGLQQGTVQGITRGTVPGMSASLSTNGQVQPVSQADFVATPNVARNQAQDFAQNSAQNLERNATSPYGQAHVPVNRSYIPSQAQGAIGGGKTGETARTGVYPANVARMSGAYNLAAPYQPSHDMAQGQGLGQGGVQGQGMSVGRDMSSGAFSGSFSSARSGAFTGAATTSATGLGQPIQAQQAQQPQRGQLPQQYQPGSLPPPGQQSQQPQANSYAFPAQRAYSQSMAQSQYQSLEQGRSNLQGQRASALIGANQSQLSNFGVTSQGQGQLVGQTQGYGQGPITKQGDRAGNQYSQTMVGGIAVKGQAFFNQSGFNQAGMVGAQSQDQNLNQPQNSVSGQTQGQNTGESLGQNQNAVELGNLTSSPYQGRGMQPNQTQPEVQANGQGKISQGARFGTNRNAYGGHKGRTQYHNPNYVKPN